MTDTPDNLAPCPPHQWRYAAIAGHFSCFKCSERVAPFDPRYRELADEWEAEGVEKALTPPMSDADVERVAMAAFAAHCTCDPIDADLPVNFGRSTDEAPRGFKTERVVWEAVARAALAALASTEGPTP